MISRTLSTKNTKRGDSLNEEFHTLEDLEYYRKSFMLLYNHCKEKNIVMYI